MSSFCGQERGEGLAFEVLADADCHAFGLVERGYAALAAPSGPVAATLNSLLVIAVAFFGYRLLLGRGAVLSDAVSLAIRIGVVLLIASSWSGWQALAYDALARAPLRVAGELLSGSGGGGPLNQLQEALDSLEAASVGYRTRAGIASPLVGGPAASAMTLNLSSILLSQSVAGLLVVCRILLAILLALGPVMAGFILFDATRGVAAGWLSAMVATALAPIFILAVAAIELAILSPLIARNLAEQAQGRFEPESVTPIGLVTMVFALAMAAALLASARIASGIRLPALARHRAADGQGAIGEAGSRTVSARMPPGPLAVAAAIERNASREAGGRAGARPAVFERPARSGGAAATVGFRPVAAGEREVALLAARRPGARDRLPRPSRAAARRDG